ncbi:MAG: NAD(P)-binding domain-containing protein, partial [Deltaproteobacteria bacterium]|nr:NAD(P)-binding domain-containing protein [Deltaproteobacteria bacterium]
MEIRKVGVLGAGQMGAGIIQVFAEAGYEVVAVSRTEETLKRAVKGLEKRLAGKVEKGKLSPDEKSAVLARIRTTTELRDLADCDLVEETISESLDLKKAVLAELDGLCKAETIFGSNTSGLSVTDMAAATKRGDRVLGM